MTTSTWVRVATGNDIADETALRVDVGTTPICLARSNGELFAVHDMCTHADVSLSEGEVEDCTVECWLHGSRFDLRTGEALCPPATVPVVTFPVKTDGDDVFVAVPE